MRSWTHVTSPAPPRPFPAVRASTYHPDEQASSDRHMWRSPSANFGAGYDDDGSGSSDDDAGIPLPQLDLDLNLDTSRLLQPPPRCMHRIPQHRVRIQGHLASVRSVSIVNLQSSPNSTATSCLSIPSTRSDIGAGEGNCNSNLGSHARANRIQRSRSAIARCISTVAATSRSKGRRSRRSLEEEDDERDVMARERDTQLRGYGIGGAGNIRKSDLNILILSDVILHCVRFGLSSDLTTLGAFCATRPSDRCDWHLDETLDIQHAVVKLLLGTQFAPGRGEHVGLEEVDSRRLL
ncbi:Udp-glucuronosyl udp-glucosyltransferase [Apiospora kogelbergensis]|uniref:Udp-glucuronosyl udp-glucosyltransferase n=1 Tax=Apiospora kogelbergensis TaxID=1337665 RepID=UPI003130F6B3